MELVGDQRSREYPNTSEEEGEVVNIEFEENEDKGHTQEEIDHHVGKHESYSSGTQSPSNSSEDGNVSFQVKKPGRKTDRQRVETGARREWTDGEIVLLIQQWKDNDILYNTNHPLYYVQTERKVAMDRISGELQIPVKDVNDKMHSLRTYYCSQRQRLGAILSTRGGEAAKHFSRWKFYDQMSFLYESVTNRAFKSSLSGKSRRKRELQRTPEVVPYMNIHDDLLAPRSPYESGFSSSSASYSDSPSSRVSERDDKEITVSSRGSANGGDIVNKRRNVDSKKDPLSGSSEQSPMSTISGNASRDRDVISDRDNCPKLSENCPNPSDEMFGHMVASSLSQIEDEQQKELLKLNLQTMIYNVRFRKGWKQQTSSTFSFPP